MFGKKIKFYRLKNKLTIADLALKLGCTSAAISQYENDHREPDMDVLKKLSDIFGITPLDLLPSTLTTEFCHSGFRTNKRLSKTDKESFLLEIEEKCSKQIEILDILSLDAGNKFQADSLDFNIDSKKAAKLIRKRLGVHESGPILSIVEPLEYLNIIVLSFDAGESIEGCNGTINGINYIFFNKNRTLERQRFTMVHEFVHLFFNHLEDIDKKELENKVNEITAIILISDEDVCREIGGRSNKLSKFFIESVAKEYIIAPSCLVRRLKDLNIVNDYYYRNFHKYLSRTVGSRKNEPSLYENAGEEPIYFEQMVYKALCYELITVSKAAELLDCPLDEVVKNNVWY